MKIVIDCRYLGMSGIGRVLEGLIENLPQNNEYLYLGNKNTINKFVNTTNVIEDNTNPFSLKGLFINKIVNNYDVFFTPNFILPFNVKIKKYIILHDLVFLDHKEICNGFIDYKIKKTLISRGIKKADKIFTVSNFTKERILHYYPKLKKEVVVCYNGLSKSIIDFKENHTKVLNKEKYIVYVGNIKKHKGLKTLVEAMKNIDEYKLYIVGNKDGFRTSDDEFNNYLKNNDKIQFTGRLSDGEMYKLVQNASFLIQPSLYEGFGIPPLEALCLGTKPIISDIPVFKEIYNDLDVVFFKVNDSNDLVEKIKNSDTNVKDINEDILNKYSYLNMANIIFGV